MIDPRKPIPFPYPTGRMLVGQMRDLLLQGNLDALGLKKDDGKLHVLHCAADSTGCGWYRAFTPAELFLGSTNYHVFPTPALTQDLVDWADIIMWQRQQSEAVARISEASAKKGKPSVYELDDNLFAVPKFNPGYGNIMSSATQLGLVRVLRTCQRVVSPNDALGTLLQSKHHNRVPFHTIPNAYLPERFPRTVNTTGKVRIGWAGSSSHVRDLRLILPALKSLAARSDVTIVIFGWDGLIHYPDGIDDVLEGIPHEYHGFVPVHQYAQRLAELALDIGFAPIENHPFNTFKSEVKWEEYTSVGAAVIASNFGPYARAITHGMDGMLANGAQEFTEFGHKLVDDAAFRRTLAANAHVTCEAGYGKTITRAKYELLYDKLVAG